MDTELVRAQERGAPVEDICAGLANSVARNYLERVVAGRPIGRRILFQGGTASNRAVVAAKKGTVVHEDTGLVDLGTYEWQCSKVERQGAGGRSSSPARRIYRNATGAEGRGPPISQLPRIAILSSAEGTQLVDVGGTIGGSRRAAIPYIAGDRTVMSSMKKPLAPLRAASRAYLHTLPSRRTLAVMGRNAACFNSCENGLIENRAADGTFPMSSRLTPLRTPLPPTRSESRRRVPAWCPAHCGRPSGSCRRARSRCRTRSGSIRRADTSGR